MSGYSEILYLVAGMMVFSMLSINTARNYNSTRQNIYRSEMEYRAIAVAQDEIDKVQWIYDDRELDPDNTSYVYEDYPLTQDFLYGPDEEYSDEFIIHAQSREIFDDGNQKRYQVTVSVINQSITPPIFVALDYVKTYNYP